MRPSGQALHSWSLVRGLGRRPRRRHGPLTVGLLGGLPVCLLAAVVRADILRRDTLADFRIFRDAGAAVLHGASPYVAPDPALLAGHDRFVYPPPVAFLFSPFSLVPLGVARILFLFLSIVAVAAALRLLGVRDWRCYGVTFLLAPVADDLVLGAMSSLLLLGVAAAWRLRERAAPAAILVALLVLAKLALWPVVVWLVAARRYRAAVWSAVTAVILTTVAWAAIAFAGSTDYPRLLHVLAQVESREAYTVVGLLSAHGVDTLVLPLSLAGLAVAAVVVAARRGTERTALAVAVAVALFATPIAWLHYFTLLLVPIALARPRLSPLWFAPLAFWLSPWPHSDGSVWRTLVVIVVAAAIVAASVVPDAWRRRRSDGALELAPREARAGVALP